MEKEKQYWEDHAMSKRREKLRQLYIKNHDESTYAFMALEDINKEARKLFP